jgi:hypothetical protein
MVLLPFCFRSCARDTRVQYRSRSAARIRHKEISVWCSGTEQPLLGRCTCHCFDPLSDSLWATVLTEQVMSEGF